ncbi:MAG: CAP domain-containing protein [Mycobacteriaceae bacterium]
MRPSPGRLITTMVAAIGIIASMAVALPAAASAAGGVSLNAYEQSLLEAMNGSRAAAGLAPLGIQPGLTDLARTFSTTLGREGALRHNPQLAGDLPRYGGGSWRTVAENVGVGGSASAVFTAYMNSPEHRDNILRANVSSVGVGTARATDGRVFDVVVFTDAYDPGYGTARTQPAPIGLDGALVASGPARFYLAPRPGAPAAQVPYGNPGDRFVTCDWNGNGGDSIGVFRNGTWLLRNDNTPGGANIVFAFGQAGDQPICGDWNGNGRDGVGVYRNGMVYLRNSLSDGPADGRFAYGNPGDVAVVGDWNGDGFDTLGVRQGSGVFSLTNSNLAPRDNARFALGNPGDRPVAGDFNGDGFDTVGVVRAGTWFLTNSNLAPRVDLRFALGNPGDKPLAGAWNGGRTDGVGVARS